MAEMGGGRAAGRLEAECDWLGAGLLIPGGNLGVAGPEAASGLLGSVG